MQQPTVRPLHVAMRWNFANVNLSELERFGFLPFVQHAPCGSCGEAQVQPSKNRTAASTAYGDFLSVLHIFSYRIL
jgi:hypothetical protein